MIASKLLNKNNSTGFLSVSTVEASKSPINFRKLVKGVNTGAESGVSNVALELERGGILINSDSVDFVNTGSSSDHGLYCSSAGDEMTLLAASQPSILITDNLHSL